MAYQCPICGTGLEPAARHPRSVCEDCASKATSFDGRALEFFNLGLSGGFGARYTDDQSPHYSHDCLINGNLCRAEEARFGGIVIEKIDATIDLAKLSNRQLLSTYCALMAAMKDRGVIRSSNNPVADYTESLVSRALGLTLEGQSQAGHDALDRNGKRYQIKGRRLTANNTSPQLGAIRNLGQNPFDFLAAVAYDANLAILYAALIPIEVVTESSRYSSHSNSHVLIFKRSLLDDVRVTDITQPLIAI